LRRIACSYEVACYMGNGESLHHCGKQPPIACGGASPPKAPVVKHVQLAVTEIFRVLGVPAYHSSVILDGREYYFDMNGVTSAPPLWSHGGVRNLQTYELSDTAGAGSTSGTFTPKSVDTPEQLSTQVLRIGTTTETGDGLVEALTPFFQSGSYDVVHKNCNAFSDVALAFLSKRRVDPQFTHMERMLRAAEPLSTSILNQLFRAASDGVLFPMASGRKSKSCEDKFVDDHDFELTEYVGNPAAQGFSAASVIQLLLDEELPEETPRADCSDKCVATSWACAFACSTTVAACTHESKSACAGYMKQRQSPLDRS